MSKRICQKESSRQGVLIFGHNNLEPQTHSTPPECKRRLPFFYRHIAPLEQETDTSEVRASSRQRRDISIEIWPVPLRTPEECYVNKSFLLKKINTPPKALHIHRGIRGGTRRVPPTVGFLYEIVRHLAEGDAEML